MVGARTENAAPSARGALVRVGLVGLAVVVGLAGVVGTLVEPVVEGDVRLPDPEVVGATVIVEIGVQAVISSLISAAWDLVAGCSGVVAVDPDPDPFAAAPVEVVRVVAGAVFVGVAPAGTGGRVPAVGRLPVG